jgi:hypothetical protein
MTVSHSEAKKNLQIAWDNVSVQDREIGEASYPSYHETLQGFAKFYGFGIVPTVEAFAALSPNNDYHGNLRSLSAVMYSVAADVPYSDLTISTYRACGGRAISYLKGTMSFLDTVGGPKITAFRDNLLYVGRSKRVTVDGHMAAIWSGNHGWTMKDAAAFLTTANYHLAEYHMRHFARTVKMKPCALQATLWVSRKRRQGIKFDSQEDLFSGKTKWEEVATPHRYPPYQTEAWATWAGNHGVT